MSTNLTVFIIDDDEDDKDIFCEIVSEINDSINCEIFSNGQEALQLLQNEPIIPDFIFLDLNMPRMNGKQFLTRIKKIERLAEIPVIIYSTSKLETDKEETKELRAEYFITKPSSMKQLKTELEFVFEKKYKIDSPVINERN